MKRSSIHASKRRTALALASSIFWIGSATHSISANTTATWIGASGLGGPGNWTDTASWSTGVVPENGSTKYDVAIDGGKPAASPVTIPSGSSFQIDNLTVDSDDSLTISNGASLTVAADGVAATLTNNGLINLNSTVSFTDLIIAGSTSLTGTGTLQLSNNFDNRFYGTANQTLTIGSGQTIQGAGEIGVGQTAIVNNGIIIANTSAGMTLSSGADAFTNNNLIEASGALLTIANTTATNTSATIQALTGGEVKFSGSTVTGGTLAATGTGFIDFASATINNVTINGNSTQENGTSVNVAGGAMTNNGIYSMNSSGALTDLVVTATTTIGGTGTFQLSNFTTNRIYANGNQTLTIGSGQTIQGAGQIGVGQTVLVNNGIIDASGSAGLAISVSGTASTNSNLIEATNTSTLTFAGTLANTGSGLITASGTAAIVLNAATISNNSITGTTTGKITNIGSSTLNNLTVNGPLINNSTLVLNTITLSGNYTGSNGSLTDATATLTNNALFTLNSTGSNTDLQITANTMLIGTGTVQMSNFVTNRIYANGNQTLTIGSGQTIQGAGQIGVGQTTIVNNAIIDANTSAGMTVSPGGSGFTNNNLLEASGAVMTLVGSYTNTAAAISALAGGEVKLNSANVTGGIFSTTGTGFIDFASSDTINNVTINGNSNQENGAAVTVAGGALANNGTYTMNASGSNTDLVINANTAISGTGTFQLSNVTTNRIYANANQTLTIGSGQTIQGAGQVGVALTVLANNGVINANSSAGLTISVVGTTSTNSNLFEAQNGSTLTLNGTFTNTGSGAITATGTAAIALNSATISNNSITGTATGKITSTGSSTLNNLTVNGPLVNSSGTLALNTVTLNGNYTGNNGSVTDASGTVTNNATFSLNSTGSNTDLQITANTLLNGTGTVQLSNNFNNRIYASANQTLTIGSGQTIQGAGQIGVGQTTIVNNAIIDANTSAGMTVSPGGSGFTNNNLLEASGAVMTLVGSYTNTAAAISALAGGEVKLNGANVTGGIFSTTGTGFIDFASSDTINNVTINGNSNQENGAAVTVAGGALANNGTYTMNASGSNTDLIINANTAISGTGTFQLSSFTTNRIYANASQTLTIGSGQTIQGAGQIGVGQTSLTNNGVIDANTSAGMIISVNGSNSANNNLIEATSSATLQLFGTMANTGTLSTGNTSTILIAGTVSQTGGTITNPGSLTVTGTLTSNAASSVSNTGTLKVDQGGTATISTALPGGGNVIVGDPSGSLSHLTVQSITQNSLLVDATGRFAISNNASATANTLNSLTINTGGQFDISNNHIFINYGAGPDPIASIAAWLASGYATGAWNGPGINSSTAAVNSAHYGVGYADAADPGNPAGLPSGTIEIAYTLLGDADLNRVVNGIDFGILAANFNKAVSRWDQGDFNYDNIVNGIDFGSLAANFNKGANGAAVGGSALSDPALVAFAEANGLMADVPEPAALATLTLVCPAFLARRRRLASRP